MSTLFTALPEESRQKWLNQAGVEDRWLDMLVFLGNVYDRAMKKMALPSFVEYKPVKRDVNTFFMISTNP